MRISRFLTCSIILSISANSFAQKPPIDHSVYDQWKTVSTAEISKTGQLIHYQITPQAGDALFELKTKENQLLFSSPRVAEAKLTHDESFLIAKIKPTFEETRQAKIKKKKSADMPKDSLVILNIHQQQHWKIPSIASYKLAQHKNEHVAFLAADSARTLQLRNLVNGDTSNFSKVDQFAWSPDEDYLLFSRKKDKKDSLDTDAGLYLFKLADKTLKKISSGSANYKDFLFDDRGNQLTFLADKTEEKALLKDFKLYYYRTNLDTARIIASQQSVGIPNRWYISGDGQLTFSADGTKLFFGLAPIPKVRDTTLVDFEHAQVDIWHWQDDYIQPQQLVNLKKNKEENFLAVISLKDNNRVIPLVDDTFNRTSMTDAGNNEWVLATSDLGRRITAQWEGFTLSDVYIVSTLSGQKRLVKEQLNGYALLSPTGDYVVYFDRTNSNWFSYEISTGHTILLNEGLPVNFADEENDSPNLPGPYGIAAWSASGTDVYIYDRYDIWKFNLSGKGKQLITNGEGRATRTVFRYIDLNRNDSPRYKTKIIPEKKDIYISGFNEETKYNGVYTIHTSRNRKPKAIISGGFTLRNFKSDIQGETILYTKENYNASPDLYVSTRFERESSLTYINPQQSNYNWGTAELVRWTTPAGFEAEGILYKPENFDPNKKYPVIAYFYEKLSNGLYSYQAPAPTPSRLNIPYYVSNEYLVFAPDIRYEIGHPGQSAEEYVNSGMRYLAQNAWVDSTKMAIQGQSWGGYQVAHLITRTNMYAAAWSGAPVVNMTSAYGGIRWQSGMSRQFQYEKTQSRIGKTLWEARDLYIENSPLFFLDKVTTPVVIMHNDNDGAVPWYQGIEMFTALRRLQKPVWMLNYNGDEHNLMKRQNRKDIQMRQAQFFDHFLKGKPAASWIEHGVRAKDKGIDWGFE